MTIVYAILMLAFIIVVHELGHYTVGRLCGIGIEEFSVGFGKKLLQWKRKGILYSLRLIIVGGYVRFTGEDEDSEDPRAFNNQPVWKRFLTVLAGPAMNFVLAYLVAVAYLTGFGLYTNEVLPRVDELIASTPAAESGLQAGDVIVAVDGEEISYDQAGYDRMKELMALHTQGEPLSLTVERGGAQLPIETGLYQDTDGTWKMGIYMTQGRERQPFFSAIREGGTLMVTLTRELLLSIKNLIFHGEGLNEVSGTVGIVSEVSRTVSQGFDMVLYWILLISANLGLVNLLPLPALDGGRLVFLIVEGIRRKPIPRDKEDLVHLAGLVMFFALFVVLTWHDIARIIAG
ncbi:MAG: site-2 protease family protein [Clostridia bacterium]|nr:site-2 protease family protein [Clostridia bacterium]